MFKNMIIYMSYSATCKDWRIEEIYNGTNIKRACNTSSFNLANNNGDMISMLDWDYRSWISKPDIIEDMHLQIVKDNDIETVMSMDLWKDNISAKVPTYTIKKALEYADKLLKYANRVIIPTHFYCKELFDYELAYPNAKFFSKTDPYPPPEYRDLIKHILGGSPHSQIRHLTTTQTEMIFSPFKVFHKRLRQVESIDGNQIFIISIKNGKLWFPYKPHWRKPKIPMTNEEIFKISVRRFDKEIKKLNKYYFR